MLLLILGVLLWSAAHLSKAAAPGVRAGLIERLGEGPYKGLFALTIVASLVLIVVGWRSTLPSALWHPPAAMRHVTMLLMPFAVILFVSARAPTDIKQFIRHPQLTGVKLWAVAHLLSNGELRSVVLFGGLLAWAVLEVIFINRRDGAWVKRRGGSGRELAVFPDPVGSLDCYRAALPDAVLLHRAFPGAQRIAARQAANRRQRLLALLPMLRRPHPEGRIGAIRVEVRGRRGGVVVADVVGAIDRPAVAAGAVAGLAARWCLTGRIPPGAAGLAEVVDPVPFLHQLAEHGVRAAVFEGVA